MYLFYSLQILILVKHGRAKPEGVVTACCIAIQAQVAIGEQCANTQLLNRVGVDFGNLVSIRHPTNAEKVTHHCVVFFRS